MELTQHLGSSFHRRTAASARSTRLTAWSRPSSIHRHSVTNTATGPKACASPRCSYNVTTPGSGILDRLEEIGQVLFCQCEPLGAYAASPNGSARDTVGIINEEGNVLGHDGQPGTELRASAG